MLALGYPFLTNASFKTMGAITFCCTAVNLLTNIFWAVEDEVYKWKTFRWCCAKQLSLCYSWKREGNLRKQGRSHMCLPFNLESSNPVESLLIYFTFLAFMQCFLGGVWLLGQHSLYLFCSLVALCVPCFFSDLHFARRDVQQLTLMDHHRSEMALNGSRGPQGCVPGMIEKVRELTLFHLSPNVSSLSLKHKL